MSSMFDESNAFNQDIGRWNVGTDISVTLLTFQSPMYWLKERAL
jgi:hypothetical protein